MEEVQQEQQQDEPTQVREGTMTERDLKVLEELHGSSKEEKDNDVEDPYNKRNNDENRPSYTTLQHICCPHNSMTKETIIPLLLCIVALTLTGVGSWDCHYFQGATISFTGNNYGLWAIENTYGQCTTYDVIFFSYKLDPSLKAARFFSMAAMLIGLAMCAVLTQALQFHAASWTIGGILTLLFVISVSTTKTFNLWVIFFLFTYVIFILIVRFLFIHPVHRRISQRGTKILAFHFALCSLYSILTLVVLNSQFCSCKDITAEKLEGREPGSPCDGQCTLGTAGGLMIGASIIWACGCIAVIKFGVQPEQLKRNKERCKHFANYPKDSIATRFITATGFFTTTTNNNKEKKVNNNNNNINKPISTTTALQPIGESGESGEDGEIIEEEENDNNTNNIVENNNKEAVVIEDNTTDNNERQVLDDDDNNDNDNDPRSCCQKVCFDYRVTSRSRNEKICFWLFRTALGILIAIYIFIIVLFSGSFSENTNAAKAPDTSYNFITDVVCAYNPLDPTESFQDFPTKQDAIDAGYVVAHCGGCGYCSNPYDIRAYVETRKTVAKSAKKCGPIAILGTYDDLVDCLIDRINFSRPCTECWADNMQSTAKYCLMTCITTLFTGQMTSNNVKGAGDRGWLNQCLFCDEKRSGPEFVTCSGVARRRLGISSEIERNPNEQCQNVDFDWLTIDWDTQFPNTPSSF